jgi:hypothetical protein
MENVIAVEDYDIVKSDVAAVLLPSKLTFPISSKLHRLPLESYDSLLLQHVHPMEEYSPNWA